jgi:hypothetical protein
MLPIGLYTSHIIDAAGIPESMQSMQALLNPKAIAVIGACSSPAVAPA